MDPNSCSRCRNESFSSVTLRMWREKLCRDETSALLLAPNQTDDAADGEVTNLSALTSSEEADLL